MRMTRLTIWAIVFAAFSLGACATFKGKRQNNSRKQYNLSEQKAIVDYSMSCLNKPYRYGATGPSSFDCSGFTYFIFRKSGYHLPRNTREQARKYPKVSRRLLDVGDLVFFEGRRKNGRVGHVGIVKRVRNDGAFDFIHASVSKGITISSSQEKYYKKRYVKAVRVLNGSGKVTFSSNPSELTSLTEESVVQIIYTVKKGDNLYKIAREYGCSITQLKEWNPGLTNLILVGDRLFIHKRQ